MLSNKRYHIAWETGSAVALSHFLMCLNPEYRGPRFVWSDLYSIVERFSRTSVGMSGDFGRDQKQMEELSAASARHTLDRCFQESNVQHWLPLQGDTQHTLACADAMIGNGAPCTCEAI